MPFQPAFFSINYLMSQKMRSQPKRKKQGACGRGFARLTTGATSLIAAAVLSACANYAGIHSDSQMAKPQSYATTQSLPSEQGNWPLADWADQFGDAQLKTLIDEALKDSPTLEQAKARVKSASAYREASRANTLPQANASYTLTRERYSGNALVPPPYGDGWET
jgi:outer membrane protein TolC